MGSHATRKELRGIENRLITLVLSGFQGPASSISELPVSLLLHLSGVAHITGELQPEGKLPAPAA